MLSYRTAFGLGRVGSRNLDPCSMYISDPHGRDRTFDFIGQIRLNRGCAASLNRNSEVYTSAAVVAAVAALNVTIAVYRRSPRADSAAPTVRPSSAVVFLRRRYLFFHGRCTRRLRPGSVPASRSFDVDHGFLSMLSASTGRHDDRSS